MSKVKTQLWWRQGRKKTGSERFHVGGEKKFSTCISFAKLNGFYDC